MLEELYPTITGSNLRVPSRGSTKKPPRQFEMAGENLFDSEINDVSSPLYGMTVKVQPKFPGVPKDHKPDLLLDCGDGEKVVVDFKNYQTSYLSRTTVDKTAQDMAASGARGAIIVCSLSTTVTPGVQEWATAKNIAIVRESPEGGWTIVSQPLHNEEEREEVI